MPATTSAKSAKFAKSTGPPKITAAQVEDIRRLAGTLKTRDSLIIEGWDLGGQPIFAILHHLYMTRFSLFCELFDMRHLVPDAEQRFPDAFPDVPHGVSPREHALGAMRFWLNSIVVHTAGADPEDDFCAPFVLVGTHKDIVQSTQDHMQISKLLHDTFGSHPAWPKLQRNRTQTGGTKNLLWFFPIDNTAGHADPVLGMLLAVIEKAIREEKYVHRRIPISWYGMYDELKRVLNSGQPTISFSRAVELGAAAGLQIGGEQTELKALLRFLHMLGILMYFNEPGLDSVVVLDPQWLVTAATKIICEFSIHDLEEHRTAQRTTPKSWSALTRSAELSPDLLPVLWHEHDESTRNQLLSLMVKFGLAVPKRDASFLIPALLTKAPEKVSSLYRMVAVKADVQHASYFIFSLRDQLNTRQALDIPTISREGFLPTGFFPRVLGKCVSWGHSTQFSGAPEQLTQSHAIVSFGGDRALLSELPDWNCIRVVLLQDNVLAAERVASMIQQVIAECMPRLCCDLMLPAPTADSDDAPGLALSPPTDDGGHLLSLTAIREVACNTENGSLWSGHEQMHQLRLQTTYPLWLPSIGRLDSYELMISYRHQATQDSECAAKLSDGLGSGSNELLLFGPKRRRLRVFLDSIRLSMGTLFVQDIMQAMLHSRVVCPIISADSLRRMEQIADIALEQTSTVYIICSTSEKDLQGREVMKMLERLCEGNPQLFVGYDWAGSSNQNPNDLPDARRARGLEPIDWSKSESVRTSDWWVGYKVGIKGKVMMCAQMPGVKQIVMIALDGGPISQLEARELPILKQQAQFDLETKSIAVELSSVEMSFDTFLREH